MKLWGRRELLALVGLGVGVAAKAGLGSDRTALADGRVIGAPAGYAPYDSPSDGVQGYTTGANNAGTFGRNNDLNGVGVYGIAPAGVGVHGDSSTGTAVGARSTSGPGIWATSNTSYGGFGTSNYIGVEGWAGGTGTGVLGASTSGVGVFGTGGPSNFGVYASAGYGGVYGESAHAGVWGVTSSPTGAGVWGQALSPGTWAGQFSGDV
jgi:hypothetical protein